MPLVSRVFAIGLITGLLGVTTAHAHEIGCQSRLVVTQFFPWPEPTPDMRDALRRMSEDRDLDASHRRAIAAAIAHPSLHVMIQSLFAPATVMQVRTVFANEEPLRPDHPLARDATGLRTTLARSLAAIGEVELQREWMRFLAHDRARAVRVAAAQTFLEWEDDAARDAYLLDPNLPPGEVLDRITAAQRELSRVSPYARWFVVKALAPYRERPSEVLTRAIESLDDVALPKNWYRDQMRARTIVNRLHGYLREPLNPEQTRFSAFDTGQLLNQIGNAATRREVVREIERLGRTRDLPSLAGYATEILLWNELWEVIYESLREGAQGRRRTPEDVVLRFAKISTDEDVVRLAKRAYDAESLRMVAPRGENLEEDLKTFEAKLRRY